MITAKLDAGSDARFKAALKQLALISGKPVQDVMRQQGRLFARDASMFTKRFGNNKSHGAAHKKRIAMDIQRVYKPAKWATGLIGKVWGSTAAKRFAGHLKAKNIGKMQDMVNRANLSSRFYEGRRVNVIMWDGGAAHTRFEKRKLRGGNPVSLVVNFTGNVKRFREAKQKNVGSLKSGWADAARDLGGVADPTKGIPPYVKKGHKRRGSGSVKGTGDKTILTITNKSNYIIGNTSAKKLWAMRTGSIEEVVKQMVNRRQRKLKRQFKL